MTHQTTLPVAAFYYALRHPEIFAVALGYLFAGGTFYFLHSLQAKHLRDIRPQIGQAICTFLWVALVWSIMDPDRDYLSPKMWIITLGVSILSGPLNPALLQFIKTHNLAFFKVKS